jgi:hypothetical protein
VGGYLAPLIAQDPDNLTAVLQYDLDLTAWLRARIMGCGPDATPGADAGPVSEAFELLPPSESAAMSQADFDVAVALFLSVVDMHDGGPDEMSAHQKAELKQRLKSFGATVVKDDENTPTKPLSPPDCVPSPATGGDGG